MSKEVILHNLELETLAPRDCIDNFIDNLKNSILQSDTDENKLNIVKVHLAENVSVCNMSIICEGLSKILKSNGVKNTIIIPCGFRGIIDFSIDSIEVKYDYNN